MHLNLKPEAVLRGANFFTNGQHPLPAGLFNAICTVLGWEDRDGDGLRDFLKITFSNCPDVTGQTLLDGVVQFQPIENQGEILGFLQEGCQDNLDTAILGQPNMAVQVVIELDQTMLGNPDSTPVGLLGVLQWVNFPLSQPGDPTQAVASLKGEMTLSGLTLENGTPIQAVAEFCMKVDVSEDTLIASGKITLFLKDSSGGAIGSIEYEILENGTMNFQFLDPSGALIDSGLVG